MTVTVLSGPERRRRWTTAEKLRIVEESQAPDAVVSEIARRHDVHPNLLACIMQRRDISASVGGALW
jgi:transposase